MQELISKQVQEKSHRISTFHTPLSISQSKSYSVRKTMPRINFAYHTLDVFIFSSLLAVLKKSVKIFNGVKRPFQRPLKAIHMKIDSLRKRLCSNCGHFCDKQDWKVNVDTNVEVYSLKAKKCIMTKAVSFALRSARAFVTFHLVIPWGGAYQ